MTQLQKIGKVATTVGRDPDGTLRVRYHWTDVVVVHPNGSITLNTNGYKTATTKVRMNQASHQFALGFQVWQKDFAWFVDVDGHTIPFDNDSLTIRNGSDA